VNPTDPGNLRERELEHRIEELEALDRATFGHFSAWDWAACIAFAFVLPLLGVWWFAP